VEALADASRGDSPVLAALDALPEGQREVVRGYVLDDIPYGGDELTCDHIGTSATNAVTAADAPAPTASANPRLEPRRDLEQRLVGAEPPD
jgi:hypothetical protein